MTAETPLELTRLVNLRDVAAGVPGLNRDVLLRSDAPRSGDRHEGYLTHWPPRTIIDLRDAEERDGQPHPFDSSAAVHYLPLLNGRARDTSSYPDSLGELYVQMLAAPGAGYLVSAIEAIATGDGPVLVHCAIGKDRTGVTVALALTLAGVDEETIVSEYALTNAVMDRVRARTGTVRAHVAGEQARRLSDDFAGAPSAAIEMALGAWRAHRGGALGWYLDNDGSPQIVAALRSRLLD
ncbi:MAG: tyrosine-protein phosphatase [Cumulibacter sp.]